MKNECSIVRDLLPLYVEKMVSEETAEFIKEHLESCSECKKNWESCIEPQITQPTPQENEPAPLINIKRKLRAKKIRAVVITAVLIVALAVGFFAVSAKHFSEWYMIAGEISDLTLDQNGKLVSFTLQEDDGDKKLVTLEEDSVVFSMAESFLEGEIEKAVVTVEYKPFRSSYTKIGEEKLKTYEARIVNIDGFFTGETVQLDGGTVAEEWRYTFCDSYNLPDGTNLMYDRYKIFSGTHEVEGLSDEAAEKIVSYITSEGVLYDEKTVLENAYSNYLETGSADFEAYNVGQETRLTVYNDTVVHFETVASSTGEDGIGIEQRVGTAFNRETGEHIPAAELLACTEDEAIEKIMNIAGVIDEESRQAIAEAFDPENIIFYQENFEIFFPFGTVAHKEYYVIGVYYDEATEAGIFKEWVLP